MRNIHGFGAIILCVVGAMVVTGTAAEPAAGPAIDQAWQQLLTYDAGQPDDILHVIERHVGSLPAEPAAKAQAAEKLATVLTTPTASPAARIFACKQLAIVGGDAQVPLLAKMLDNAETAEIARYTLQAIPGESSLAALRGALARLKGTPQIGAINSLGVLRDAGSVEPLAKLLASPDAQTTAAAAEALGKIGTAPAAAALTKAQVPAGAAVPLHNARLQCGERLAAAGDTAAAAAIFEQLWSSDLPPARRIGGLVGLARFCKDKASPRVLEALASDDALIQATAVQLIRQLPGPQVTTGLVARLDKLDAAGQTLLLGMLAERGDRSAAAAVLKRLDDTNEPVRVAAIDALAKLGDVSVVDRLVALAATGGGAQAAARRSLTRLAGAEVEAKLSALAAQGAAAARAEAIRALAGRGSATAAAGLLTAATDADAQVRAAAVEALAALAPAEVYGKLVGLLAAAAPADMPAAERAVIAAGGRVDDPAQRLAPVVTALDQAAPPAKAALLRVLGGFGGGPALTAVSGRLTDAETTVRDAAVRSLAGWPDASAAPELLKVAQSAESATHRALALRGYLRLAGEVKEASARLKMLEAIRPIATTPQAKRLLLAALSEAGDPGALHVATEMLTDADVPAEAAVATLKISKAVLRADPNGVRVAMRKLLDAAKDQAVREQATALDEEAQHVPSPDALQQALRYDKKRSDAQKAAVAKRAPAGFELACYLDCGPDAADGAKDRPFLRLVSGAAYVWTDTVRAGDLRLVTINFDGQQVVFEATGLNPKRAYQLGFTWWDFDHNTRMQSVAAVTGKGREVKLLDKTKLPAGPNNEPAAEKTLPLPADVAADGPVRIVFRNESQPNAVVSELWLWESK